MENENFIKLIAVHDKNLPKNTIGLSSKLFSEYKDNKQKLSIIRFPIISMNSLVGDINIIEKPNLNDNFCIISTDIAIINSIDFSGDVINLINLE